MSCTSGAVQLDIPGIVPNPFVPLSGLSMPTSVVPSADPVGLPSSGELHIHFAAVYSKSTTLPTASKLTLTGDLDDGNTVTATALAPFGWKKTSNGDYIAIVQFNYDSPVALTGQNMTVSIKGDDGDEYFLLADCNDMTNHFKVFHGLTSGGGPSNLPSSPLQKPLLPGATQGTIHLSTRVTEVTVYTNTYVPAPGTTPPITVNGNTTQAIKYGAAQSPFLPTMAYLTIDVQKLPPTTFPATLTVSGLPTALGGFAQDSSGNIYFSTVGTGIEATGGRPVGPVTPSCRNCYDALCPMADMQTGDCATSRVDIDKGRYNTIAFSNNCVLGTHTTPCYDWADKNDNVEFITSGVDLKLSKQPFEEDTPQGTVYYLPEAVSNTAPGNNLYIHKVACEDPNTCNNCQSVNYGTGQGTEDFPYCPEGTEANVTCEHSPVVSDGGKFVNRYLKCVRKQKVQCPNGYVNWGTEQNCVMIPPIRTNSVGDNTVCKFDESGWNIGCVPGDNYENYVSVGWKLDSCSSHIDIAGPMYCKASFIRTGADPVKGEYYFTDDSYVGVGHGLSAIQSQFNPSVASKCTQDTCDDAVQSILFNDYTQQWETNST